jgi:hypothetical protein
MPRLTRRVFTDLAIWMAGIGLLIGIAFPPFCLLLGLPAERLLTPLFAGSTVAAGSSSGPSTSAWHGSSSAAASAASRRAW